MTSFIPIPFSAVGFMESVRAAGLADELSVTCHTTFPKKSSAIDDTFSVFDTYFTKSSKHA